MDGSNFVDYIPFVRDEATCKTLCSFDHKCNVYTYYNISDPNEPEVCIKLSNSGLQKTATQCDHCKTGSAECKADQECEAAVLVDTDGVPFNFPIFAKESFSATLMSGEKDCYWEVQALAIGGGGGGGYRSPGGGGGSGYVEFSTLQIRRNVSVGVGAAGESSSIEVNNQLVLSAAPGENYNSYGGGAGYSGGGGAGTNDAHPGGDGGENGGDGEDGTKGSGGDGSGFDLTTVRMEHFILSPGKGGTKGSGGAGGGGGVIVNGEKPAGGTVHDGEGFGGGSLYISSGYPGCVLIDL